MILETTALIDLLRNQPTIYTKISELMAKHVPIFITTISMYEIWQGTRNIEEYRLNKINILLDSIPTLNFDKSAAKEAGLIQSVLKNKGIIIDPEDVMIAGIAKVNNQTILTRNIKHFEKIDGISLSTY